MKKMIYTIMLMVLALSVDAQDATCKTDSMKHDTRIYSDPYSYPSFRGGQKALFEFFDTNIKYPEEVTQTGIHGRVIISFVINEDGTLDGFKVVKNTLRNSEDSVCTDSTIIRLFEEEALRVCRLMPRWAPGKQNGQAVKVRYTIPILFRKNELC
jgi:hypothetical protein